MTKESMKYQKLLTALKYYLLGKGYFMALKALDFAKNYHTGLRKDMITNEFEHQVDICLYLSTLKDVQNEELVLTVALLHDLLEDYDVSETEIESRFGKEVCHEVWLLTKKYRGKVKDPDAYFKAIGNSRVASIVKAADRHHNISSMVGVFTAEKQAKYIQEAEEKFLPMIKRAKHNFPEQTHAYMNVQHMLQCQMYLIKSMLKDRK